MRRVVFTDLDGTLVEKGKNEIGPRNWLALNACRERMAKVVPVTGRPWFMAKPLLEAYGLFPAVINDGAQIVSPGHTHHWAHHIDYGDVVSIIRTVNGSAVEYEGDGFGGRIAAKLINTVHLHATHRRILASIREEGSEVPLEGLASIGGVDSYVTDSWKEGRLAVRIVPRGITKLSGVEAFLDAKTHLGNCMAIGDDENDIPMLTAVHAAGGFAVVMGNAHPDLLPDLPRVPSVEEGGFAVAVNQFLAA